MACAESRLAVLDTISRWSHAADGTDPGSFAAVVTDDTVFEVGGSPAVVGRDAVAEHVVGPAAHGVRRHVRNTVIDALDDVEARARSYYLITRIGASGRPEPVATGVYTDDLVKTAAGWRIRSRHADPDVEVAGDPRA